jgi:CRP-like cAMP-binding protein
MAASTPSAGTPATTVSGWRDGERGAASSSGQPPGRNRSRPRGARPAGKRPQIPGSRTEDFAPGQRVFAPGAGAGMIFVVRAGCIRHFKTLPDGRSINLGLLGPNTVFTQDGGGDGLSSGSTAEALLDSTVLIVDEDYLGAVIARSPELAAPLVRGMTRRLATMQTLVEHLMARDASVRLAMMLVALADASGEQIDGDLTRIAIPVSRQGLADMIGANRVTVTRKLVDLERSGTVRTLGRAAIAVDRAALRRHVQTIAMPAGEAG